tara:strand:+ start:1537 stop:2160 length:624 start_codon:yes stop_codon:yes gene_type:complete
MKIGYELEMGRRSCVDMKNVLGFGEKFRYEEYLFLKKINKYEFSIFIKRINFQHLKKISFFSSNKKDVLYPDNIDGKKIILKSMSIFYFEGDYILSNEYKSEYYKKIGSTINFTKKLIKVLENWIKKIYELDKVETYLKDKLDIKDKTHNGLYKPLFHTNDYYTGLYLSSVGKEHPYPLTDLYLKDDYNSSNTINFKFLKNIISEID